MSVHAAFSYLGLRKPAHAGEMQEMKKLLAFKSLN